MTKSKHQAAPSLDTWHLMRAGSWDPMPQDDLPNLLSALGVATGASPAEQKEAVASWLKTPAAFPCPPILKRAAKRFAGVKDAA